MEGKTRTVTGKESIYTVKQLDPSEYWWRYRVLGKNDDGSFNVEEKQITTEDGKNKKILDKYIYDLASCTFCGLCSINCPQKAIVWSNNFEHSVFTREAMKIQLNKEGSKVAEKKAVTPKE
jgi:Pyruvate/2-oxoacid:ferredoxin oxidoreductase delta subunit